MAAIGKEHRPGTKKGRKESLHVSNLQPLKRKLDKIETERIYRVIQATLKQLKQAEIVTSLIQDDAHIFRLNVEELRHLMLWHQQNALSNLTSDKGRMKIQDSIKAIFRYCGENNINLNSYNPQSDIIKYYAFTQQFEELSRIALERLLTEGVEQCARWKFLFQTMEKSRSAQNAIMSLKKTLKDKERETEIIINEKDRIIRQLSHDLEFMKSSAEEENNGILNNAAKQILSNRKSIDNKSNKLSQDIISLKDEVYKVTKKDYDKESKLRKRKFKMAGELYNWIVKFDQDMGWRQDQIDDITALNEKELEETHELEEHFAVVEKEYNTIIEERRQKAEEKKQREKMERHKKMACVKIQAMWRGFMIRKQVKRKKGAKKGGGKGR